MTTIYIKPMTWAGEKQFYVGLQPSNPAAEPGYRLGSYFLICPTESEAHAIARAEARRMTQDTGREWNVEECPHYVGYERVKE